MAMKLMKFYLILDLFLLPSEESFGLAALETMAWSVPVISSNSWRFCQGSKIFRFQDIYLTLAMLQIWLKNTLLK
jgi:hypothetical protein